MAIASDCKKLYALNLWVFYFGGGRYVDKNGYFLYNLVNIKIVNGVRAITNLRNYNNIDLVTPTYFLGEE